MKVKITKEEIQKITGHEAEPDFLIVEAEPVEEVFIKENTEKLVSGLENMPDDVSTNVVEKKKIDKVKLKLNWLCTDFKKPDTFKLTCKINELVDYVNQDK